MRRFLVLPLFLIILLLSSCGESTSPVNPAQNRDSDVPDVEEQSIVFSPEMVSGGRHLFGFWELMFDFDNVTAEAVPLRFIQQHVNVRRFLEEAPCFICLRLLYGLQMLCLI